MKKMARSVSLLLFIVISFGMISGCHGSRGMSDFSVPNAFNTSKTYEITFWAKNDTNKTQTEVYKKAIKDFQDLYSNITVNMRLYTNYGDIYKDVITNISTNTTPNVCITYPDHIATYLKGKNTVVPLDALFSDEKYGFGGSELRFDGPDADEMITKFLDECIIDGHHYAVPYMRSTEACYINKTLVEKLGYEIPDILTWDFVWEVSDAAAQKDADGNYLLNGQKVMLPFIYKSTDNMMIQMLKQKGYGYSDDEGNILIFNDDTRELLYTVAEHTKKGAFSTFQISGYPANFLNAGQCVFAVDSTAGATWMGKAAPHVDISPDKMIDYEIEVRAVPQFDVSDPKMISQGPSVCVFNKEDPQEVLASWLFTQFLLTNEVQLSYSQTEGYAPVTHKARESAEYKDYLSREGEDGDLYYDVKIKATKLLLDNIDNTFITPVFVGSTSLRDAAGQLIENVTKSVRRKETVDERYIVLLYSDVSSLYRLDQLEARSSLGRLPSTAIWLISVIAFVWVVIGINTLVSKILKKNKSKLR